MENRHIYVLLDPREGGLTCYVGQTRNPARRWPSFNAGAATNPRVRAWFRDLRVGKSKPIFKVLEVVPAEDARATEGRYIDLFRKERGPWCLNILTYG